VARDDARRDFDLPEVEIVPDGGPAPLWRPNGAVSQSTAPCDPDDTWDNGTLDDYPGPITGNASRTLSTVWTGTLMLVWGSAGDTALGGRYDPLTDVWQSISSIGAPGSPQGTTAVWSGSEMLI